jgi:hypothetical protein
LLILVPTHYDFQIILIKVINIRDRLLTSFIK